MQLRYRKTLTGKLFLQVRVRYHYRDKVKAMAGLNPWQTRHRWRDAKESDLIPEGTEVKLCL